MGFALRAAAQPWQSQKGEDMRIFEVKTEWRDFPNYASYRVAARTCEEAIKKAKKHFHSGERAIEVELLASTNA